MPIHGYPGNVITANPTAPTVSSASGVWTTEQQLINQSAGNWPMAQTQVSLSARFNSADSAYLSRTPASAGNRKTWTWSGWVKRSRLGTEETLFASGDSTSNSTFGQIIFASNDTLRVNAYSISWRITSQVFRDVSSWYHIIVAFDTTQATAANRVKVYVNGLEVTAFSTSNDPTQNTDYAINQAAQHTIGRYDFSGGGNYLSSYLAEINFIDGLALTPAYFGFNDSNTGAWTPKQYTGAYGTNGFYLQFNKEGIGVDFLVIAGGGGGDDYGGGGGGGGYRTSVGTSGGGASAESQFVAVPGIAYTVTVGAGGAIYISGNNSVLGGITSIGGGNGSRSNNNGGSGGGGGAQSNPVGSPGSGTTGQGYAGGTAIWIGQGGNSGGGGGAGGVGSNATSTVGGNGGTGVTSSITGSSVCRAGGGGGNTHAIGSSGNSTATCGGGNGGVYNSSAAAGSGSVNTGGGGGGGGGRYQAVAGVAGPGGSGVVIIKIPSTYTATFSGGVTQTSTTSGGFKIYTVTATSTTSETVTFS